MRKNWDNCKERARLENRVGGEFGDPAMVAYALHHGLYEGEDTSDDVAMLRVRLALALAVEMHTMERLGYGPHEIALGAARTAHEVALQSHQRLMLHEGVPSGSELGNLVRLTIRERISLQTKTMHSGMGGRRCWNRCIVWLPAFRSLIPWCIGKVGVGIGAAH